MGRIIIKNCKCIKEAKIEIADDALNIKYAPNGTGKTTISQAIQQKINDDKLKDYMTPLDDISLEPSVESDYASIKVFNEDYVNQFIFTNKATFADSFSVFIKDDSINNISDEIEEKNKELRDFIKKNENINKLVDCINELTSIIKTKNGKVQKQGGLGELIRGYGAGFDKRIKLNIFSDYYNNPDFRLVSRLYAKRMRQSIHTWENDNETR